MPPAFRVPRPQASRPGARGRIRDEAFPAVPGPRQRPGPIRPGSSGPGPPRRCRPTRDTGGATGKDAGAGTPPRPPPEPCPRLLGPVSVRWARPTADTSTGAVSAPSTRAARSTTTGSEKPRFTSSQARATKKRGGSRPSQATPSPNKKPWQRPTLPPHHRAVPSAQGDLTTGFGKRPGVTLQQ